MVSLEKELSRTCKKDWPRGPGSKSLAGKEGKGQWDVLER